MKALAAATGPRTVEGKAKASKNAIRHGLTSKQALAPGEKLRELEAFTAELVERLGPVGELELLLAGRVASCAWRLRRVPHLEAAYSTHNAEHHAQALTRPYGCSWSEGLSARGVEGHFVRDQAAVLLNLVRYEAALERSMYRALHELQRSQASRRGEAVAVPAVVDVDVQVGGVEGEGGGGEFVS